MKGFLTPATFKKLSGLLDEGSVLLTPHFVNETQGLLTSASDLLTPSSVSNLKNLIEIIDPLLPELEKLLKPAHISALGDLLTNAHSLVTTEFVNNTRNLVMGADDIFSPYVFDGLGELLDDLVPMVPAIRKDFLNDHTVNSLSYLLGNGTALLNSDVVSKTEDLVTSAGDLLTPDLVDILKGILADFLKPVQ